MRKLLFILLLCLITTSASGQFFMPNQKPMLGLQVNWAHPLSKDLVGLWLFNEGSGGQVFDLSGNNYNGTISSGLSWVPGQTGPNIKGDNTNTHCITIPCAQGSPADLSGQGTIIVKIKPVSGSGNTTAVGRDDMMWLWCSDTNNKWTTRIDSGALLLESLESVDWGQYQTMAFTYDDVSGNGYLYKNGMLLGSILGSAVNMVSSASNWYIGEDPRDGSGTPLDGLIEFVLLYNRAFSAYEVAQLYREPFCMFEGDLTVAQMYDYGEAPAPSGQFITIQMSVIPLFILFTAICFVKGRNGNKIAQ